MTTRFNKFRSLATSLVLWLPLANVQAQLSQAQATVTFNRDIAPIVYGSCARCHHPGEAGPFPLLTYRNVKAHARQIAEVTRNRIMPPWLPEPQATAFADDMRLPEKDIELFQKWVEQGEVEGNDSDLPSPPKFTSDWGLGAPDLVLTAEKPFVLPASGSDVYWNFIFRLPITATRWARAVEIRPGDKRFVHHANILVDKGHTARSREATPGAGFGGMEIRMESQTFDPDSHFLFWKPGTVASEEPAGMPVRLDPGTDLVLNTHLLPSGKPETVQPTLGIYFTDKPATLFPMLVQLENDAKLDIPAGEAAFVVSDDFRLPVDVSLLAIYPHAHYLGRDMLAQATLPDGTTQTLIHIPHWDLNWQAVYRYAEPVSLPKGTTVSMRYTYDNSEDNYANPSHPPVRVEGGNRSSDEMAHLWLQVLPRAADARDPRMLIQEALARHNVEKNPNDFEAHYNLAAMLQARDHLQEAIPEYEQAVRLHPEDATANNALGEALFRDGNSDAAVQHFLTALTAKPDYFDASYNLGIALAEKGDFVGATEQFQKAVRLNPEDADAQANLGGALAALGQNADARAHLERALAINPAHSLARENLDQLRQAEGAR
jgi:Tfp pilus assembly protein PilF/mono/diheme cytochrome c family protein